ncbi:MAG: hypothetical protein IH840_08610 [Candidatus Heimdallarchaeota archaeon]|nr:hypothetical protein [Candidatus Heimdallarchaeota archaeon]
MQDGLIGQKRGTMATFELSQNEARVLHSLIKWPDLSDQAIHSKINMKKSTFSSIKTRLKESGYYDKYYVPNFPIIGFELFFTMFGQLNRFTTIEERMRIAKDMLEGFVEDFYVQSESNNAFNLAISANYTEYMKNYQLFINLYTEQKFLGKNGMAVVVYPFEMSTIHSFMDFEGISSQLFGFSSDNGTQKKSIPHGKQNQVKLTRAEKKVLAGLVKFPEESDTLIAEHIQVSRNTVANAKRKFLSKGICFPRVVPNLQKLGIRLINYSSFKFNSRLTNEDIKTIGKVIQEIMSPYFFINKRLEGFFISAHIDLADYKKKNEELMTFYTKNEMIAEDPVDLQLNIDNMMIIKNFDFLPMILKVLGFDNGKPISDY